MIIKNWLKSWLKNWKKLINFIIDKWWFFYAFCWFSFLFRFAKRSDRGGLHHALFLWTVHLHPRPERPGRNRLPVHRKTFIFSFKSEPEVIRLSNSNTFLLFMKFKQLNSSNTATLTAFATVFGDKVPLGLSQPDACQLPGTTCPLQKNALSKPVEPVNVPTNVPPVCLPHLMKMDFVAFNWFRELSPPPIKDRCKFQQNFS